MATLHEYYLKDFSRLLSGQEEWKANSPSEGDMNITAKVHFDFDSNTFFVSFYVPKTNLEVSVFDLLLSKLENVFKIKDETIISTKLPGENQLISSDLRFSGRVFFYYEGIVNKEHFSEFQSNVKTQGIFVRFRDINFSIERSKLETPLAFISHDSRDKKLIAGLIANQLQIRMLPIWYDEYSLKLGDSLRESIEKGLKDCKKCILILSPNFLNNLGWTKTEFNTIFTREIIETKNLVLPIWAGVSKKDIHDYSPMLVDRVGVNWDKGLEFVIEKIQHASIAE